MNRTKSSAQSTLSKPVSVISQFRFEKVEQLTNFINQAVQTPDSKNNVGQKVLEMLKTHIRTNYDNLYENYGDNKKKILKQIQTVETNIAGENAMNSRFDDLVKDKSRYDRLHAEVGDKQRKLKKVKVITMQLNEIRQKLNDQLSSMTKVETMVENNDKILNLEAQRQDFEHQAAVLKEMLSNRQSIQLSLREKQISLNQELEHKKQKLVRIGKENDKRQLLHKKLMEEIEKEEEMEIPLKLAQELSLKMEMYENKHSYNSIITHQAVLEDKRFAKVKDSIRQEREQQRMQRTKRETQERNQLEQLYSIAQTKLIQQQKIKKYCAVESIQQICNTDQLLNTENLEQLTIQIEQQIEKLEKENKDVEQKIQGQIIAQSESTTKNNIYDVENQLNREEKQKQHLNETLKKWETATHNWKIILGLLEVEPNPQKLTSFLFKIDEDLKNRSTTGSRTSLPQQNVKHIFDQPE